MAARVDVDALRPGDFPAAYRPSDNHFLAVIKKISLFALALFASAISFSLISVPIATTFSAIVLLSSLLYMFSGSTSHTPVFVAPPPTVYIAPPPPRTWTFFNRDWLRTSYWAPRAAIPVNTGHAPVGTGLVTPLQTYYAPPPRGPDCHAPRGGYAAPAGGATTPLNRVPTTMPLMPPGGAPAAGNAPVGNRSRR